MLFIKKQIPIFIVEDNKTFSIALKSDVEQAFINLNIKIHLFETGEACIEKFKIENPQVVILDYHLNSKYPDAIDGIKVLDWIIKENSETYVIMLTSEDDINIAIKSFQSGASDYVVKSESQFKKITFSINNFIKILKAKRESVKYKLELQKYKENYIS